MTMTCDNCGQIGIRWVGPLINLTHTECPHCGGKNCQRVEDRPDDAGETVGTDDTPPHLRPMDSKIVADFVSRAIGLHSDIAVLGNQRLKSAARTMLDEAVQFADEMTPWMAGRLAKMLRQLKDVAISTGSADHHIAGAASGLAADIEAAIADGSGK